MILYLNGDSHTAAGEAVNRHCFAKDDSKFWHLEGDEQYRGHPDNLAVSFGQLIADKLNYQCVNHATSAASNYKILRTTKEYLKHNNPDFVLIGWSTWEREEWYDQDDDFYYQVNGSGIDSVPDKWRLRYKEFVTSIDWNQCVKFWHEEIWQFHNQLLTLKIPHLFFNCHLTFEPLLKFEDFQPYEWGNYYIEPYSNFSYLNYLVSQNCKHNRSFHFGPDGHSKWADFLLAHLTRLL